MSSSRSRSLQELDPLVKDESSITMVIQRNARRIVSKVALLATDRLRADKIKLKAGDLLG